MLGAQYPHEEQRCTHVNIELRSISGGRRSRSGAPKLLVLFNERTRLCAPQSAHVTVSSRTVVMSGSQASATSSLRRGSCRISYAPRVDPSLAGEIIARSTRPQSRDHGEQHWKAVAWAGLGLATQVDGCDPDLVLLFALFHDSQRFNEFHDPEHGLRGGQLAREMQGVIGLDEDRLDRLVDACTRHDRGEVTDDPTVGVCWDGDRLNLWRVGKTPNPRLLSTAPARDPGLIAEAAAFHGRPQSWESLFAAYDRLTASVRPSR